MGYAEQTLVPIERTKAEIETLLVKSGCDAIATLWDKRERRVAIQFRAHNRMVRFSLTLPSPNDPQYHYTPAKSVRRSQAAAERAHDQAVRAKWRRPWRSSCFPTAAPSLNVHSPLSVRCTRPERYRRRACCRSPTVIVSEVLRSAGATRSAKLEIPIARCAVV